MLEAMRILEALADIFINTFGITQPSERMRRQAAWFIFALLVGTLALVATAGFVLYQAMHH